MIARSDRIRLAPDVAVTPRGLEDAVLGAVLPLNDAARTILERADGTAVAAIAAHLAHRFPAARSRALDDTLAFLLSLNQRALVDVSPRGGQARLVARALGSALRTLPLGTVLPFPIRRYRIDTGTAPSAARDVALALGRHCLAVSAVLGGLGAAAAWLAGLGSPWLGAALVGGSGAGIVAHEAAHAAALARVPAYLTIGLLGACVVHRPVAARRRALAAAAGPLAAGALGLVLLAPASHTGSGELALAALVATSQLAGLTLLTRDGRTACLER